MLCQSDDTKKNNDAKRYFFKYLFAFTPTIHIIHIYTFETYRGRTSNSVAQPSFDGVNLWSTVHQFTIQRHCSIEFICILE